MTCECKDGPDIQHDANTASGFRCAACGEELAVRSFLDEANPDHVAPDGMRRSIHRSHRGEGFNAGVGE